MNLFLTENEIMLFIILWEMWYYYYALKNIISVAANGPKRAHLYTEYLNPQIGKESQERDGGARRDAYSWMPELIVRLMLS